MSDNIARTMAVRSKRIHVGDIDIAVDDVGAGEPIVFVPGMACGKRMWFHQARALCARYRVIAYDQRGHGATDAPTDSSRYSPQHLARDLAGLLDALGISRAAIVGFSLGGGPALALAVSAPERVSRLVLADVGAGADNMWKSQWLARRWTGLIDRGAADELVCDMLRSEFYKRFAMSSRRNRDYMASLIRATPLIGLRHTLERVIAQRKSLHRMTGTLRTLRVPTLVLAGRHDNVCRNSAHLLAGTIPNAAIAWINDAGHMAPLENPKAFTASLASFLET